MSASPAVRHREVVCPFCAMACDDLEVEVDGDAPRVIVNGCGVAAAAFARPAGDATPRIGGDPASPEEAYGRAAEILEGSRLPLLAGLGTDTAGARAALALADRIGGVLDHAASTGSMANLRAMQDHGWVTGTLAEVRNRAQLVVLVGTDGLAAAPRLVERVLAPASGPGSTLQRRVVRLGTGAAPAGAEVVACPPERLGEAVAALRALVAGHRLPAAPPAELAQLAHDLRACPYSAVVWAAGELPGPHQDLIVAALSELLKTLNATTRAVGLPLAGADNVIGVNQVCAWQTGVPLRASLASGAPEHDPGRFATATLLTAGAVDALLWIASLHDRPPPAADVPTVALVRAGADLGRPVDVLIPVGVPGLDHAGSVYRQDGVVAMTLRALRKPQAPPVATVLRAIAERVTQPAA